MSQCDLLVLTMTIEGDAEAINRFHLQRDDIDWRGLAENERDSNRQAADQPQIKATFWKSMTRSSCALSTATGERDRAIVNYEKQRQTFP